MKPLKTIKEYIALTFVLAYCYMNRDRPRNAYVEKRPRARQTLQEAVSDCEYYIRICNNTEGIGNCEQWVELKIKWQHEHHPQMQAEYDALQVLIDHKIHELQMVEMSEYAFVAEQKWQRRIVFN